MDSWCRRLLKAHVRSGPASKTLVSDSVAMAASAVMRLRAYTTVAATRKKATIVPPSTTSLMPRASSPKRGWDGLCTVDDGLPSNADPPPTMSPSTEPVVGRR